MTMPGRAVWMFTSTSVESLRIVICEMPAWASLFSMWTRIQVSSAR